MPKLFVEDIVSRAPFELNDSIVRAGAGAGKTRGLVDRIVEVYGGWTSSEGPRIVLTTFTRKATQELKERLILRACHEKDAKLLQFVSDPSKLQITTIHGLLNIFLRQVGHLSELDAGFQIVSAGEGEQMARLALREVIVNLPESLRWLEVYGFERTLQMCRSYQTLWREQESLRPGEMPDLNEIFVRELKAWKVELATLSLSAQRFADDPAWLNYAQALAQFTESWQGEEFVGLPSKPRRSKKQVGQEELHILVEETVDAFKKAMAKPCWQRSLWPEMVREWAEFAPIASSFSAHLNAIKEAQGRFEMLDLELRTLEILRAKPFLGTVFAESWDYWMVDEYQDTSPLQVAILKALIGDKAKYLVGDPQQSIYLFRGAEVSVFSAAEEEIKAAGGAVVELRKNYRSEPDLLSWMNDFMASIRGTFQAMEPRTSPQPRQSCVSLLRASDLDQELKALVWRVERLLAEGAALESICVISRTHRGLMDASRVLKSYGYPTHVHAARGFHSRREVIDGQALWRFLLQPHDNLNLLVLLRSPWFLVADWQLSEWMKDKPPFLWRRLENLSEAPDAILRLRELRSQLQALGVVKTFTKVLCENGQIDLSLNNDPAGRKESNLWKLIHKAQDLEKQSGCILDLLGAKNENALDSNEGDATSAQEPNCINLMTIHGSKGLEFDHVLIPCMGEAPRTSFTPPLNATAGVFYFPVWNEEVGEFIASPLDVQAVNDRRGRELAEFDRWLYVALTRAKKSLTLSWTKVARGSWAERSSWFQKPAGEYSQDLYRFSVMEVFPDPGVYQPARASGATVRAAFRAAERIEQGHHSVSELVERKFAPTFNSERVLERWRAQTAGTDIHRALEALKYRGEVCVNDDPAVRFVLEMQDPPLAEWIRGGHPEWGFQVQTNHGVVEGQIDLWVKSGGRIYIVDYKTGSPAQQEAAFTQLSLYAWALRRFGHEEPIECIVVYPLHQKVVRRACPAKLILDWESEFRGAEAAR